MDKNQEIAKIILNQMGGNGKIIAMVGGHNFVAIENGIQFHFKGSKKINCIRIILNEMDTYNVEFYKLNMKKAECPTVNSYENIYAEDLKEIFEKETGLYLSF